MTGTAVAAALIACVAAYGAHLLYTSVVLRWDGLGPGPRPTRSLGTAAWSRLRRVRLHAFGFAGAGALATLAVFGAPTPALLAGVLCGTIAQASERAKAERRREQIAAAWPPLLEEVRVLAGAAGRPIPQALFQAGSRAPAGVRDAFAVAGREWHATTDFARALSALKSELAESSSDVICETLLVAHQVGGTGVDARLEALIDDRSRELDLRRDASSRQAGARFARRFVLIVPLGMALVGLSLGTGRAAYESRAAQLIVAAALALIAACWVWAGHLLRIPRQARVFS